ncbi:hypothetical protein ACHMWU_22030 [Aeromicrobium sp. UC242_57]
MSRDIDAVLNDPQTVLPTLLLGSDTGAALALDHVARRTDLAQPDAVAIAGLAFPDDEIATFDDEIGARTACPTTAECWAVRASTTCSRQVMCRCRDRAQARSGSRCSSCTVRPTRCRRSGGSARSSRAWRRTPARHDRRRSARCAQRRHPPHGRRDDHPLPRTAQARPRSSTHRDRGPGVTVDLTALTSTLRDWSIADGDWRP